MLIHFYPGDRLDTKNASKYVGLSVKTLATKRSKGGGPDFFKLPGGRIFYFKSRLDEWIKQYGPLSTTAQARFQMKQENI